MKLYPIGYKIGDLLSDYTRSDIILLYILELSNLFIIFVKRFVIFIVWDLRRI